jgi:hypothetical protein
MARKTMIKKPKTKTKPRKLRVTKSRVVEAYVEPEPLMETEDPSALCPCGECFKANRVQELDKAVRHAVKGATNDEAFEVGDYMVTIGIRMMSVATGNQEPNGFIIPTPSLQRLLDAVDHHAKTSEQPFDAIVEALIGKLRPEVQFN